MSSLAGTFLVARSSLHDGFFGRSVVLLLQHGPEGAFGLVLNRPAKAKELPFAIFVGGPCKTDGLLMIHGRTDWLKQDETLIEHFGKTRDDRIREFHEMNATPVVGLWEAGILVCDGMTMMLHDTPARVFRQDQPAVDLEVGAELGALR